MTLQLTKSLKIFGYQIWFSLKMLCLGNSFMTNSGIRNFILEIDNQKKFYIVFTILQLFVIYFQNETSCAELFILRSSYFFMSLAYCFQLAWSTKISPLKPSQHLPKIRLYFEKLLSNFILKISPPSPTKSCKIL